MRGFFVGRITFGLQLLGLPHFGDKTVICPYYFKVELRTDPHRVGVDEFLGDVSTTITSRL